MDYPIVYENKYRLEEKKYSNFVENQKTDLNTVEMYGLMFMLMSFVSNYEDLTYGDVYTDISKYARFNKDSVDILDGYTNTYIFDGFAIDSIWMTNNGIVILDCREIGNLEVDYIDINDFPRALFRLN